MEVLGARDRAADEPAAWAMLTLDQQQATVQVFHGLLLRWSTQALREIVSSG